ncbi:MAG TPA: sigma 54-interacting transcriptional regulator, partial [Thermoanaerobaculia bacterium]|nr:sigma 54-interacting transcriptional regulator [Thermoanaerobaculia bacterium]
MLERLLELGKRVLAESDLDRVLTAALDGVIELCGAERGMILLFDTEGPEGEVVVETARNLAREDIERPEFEVSRGILRRVRSSGERFWHPNVLDDPALGSRESVLRLLILSVICHPIRHGGQLLGVVYLDNRSVEGLFSEETAGLVASFSEFISLAARNALERRRLQQDIGALAEELRGRYDFGAIVGQDPALLAVLKLISQVADSDATILIQGESGTGKELVARALHFNSRRRAKPFVPVNCGALPENLLESELFGHVRGSFTGAVANKAGRFQSANKGTLFLDEIGEMPLSLQVKILRALQDRTVNRVGDTANESIDIRVIAATNRDLEVEIKTGRFREDLYYRLNVVLLHLPPLRERG